MKDSLFINGHWQTGAGDILNSTNPSTGQSVWQGGSADRYQVDQAVMSARNAFSQWRATDLQQRIQCVQRFTELLKQQQSALARLIVEENGKPLWDATAEVAAMMGKADISIQAYHQRTGTIDKPIAQGQLSVAHKPHGVLAIFGPFNFPGHLPNGHIIPALIAGNCIVFKPSEHTPAVAEYIVRLWQQAGLPDGVLNMVQGNKITGGALAEHPQLDGLLFTGSAQTGQYLHAQYAGQPQKILALEMGGNNPLVVEAVSDIQAALYITLFSAFVSSGQRCTCARRLYVPEGEWGDRFVRALVMATQSITVGDGFTDPQPFLGALISTDAGIHLQQGIELMQSLGGKIVVASRFLNDQGTLMTPCLIDMSESVQGVDEEWFGPILQVYRYQGLSQAIDYCNDTRFGLAAGIVTDEPAHFKQFYDSVRAGIINGNQPLTGASSEAPFGGVGASGNHRPSAYYAADYSAYPVASICHARPTLPNSIAPGIAQCLIVK